jgi:hypothetical protein
MVAATDGGGPDAIDRWCFAAGALRARVEDLVHDIAARGAEQKRQRRLDRRAEGHLAIRGDVVRGGMCHARASPTGDEEPELEHRAAALAVAGRNVAAELLHDAVANREPKA